MTQEVVGETGWQYGAHNYLKRLLVKLNRRHDWRRWPRPDDLTDVVVVRPRARMRGWSMAPQTGGVGMVHLVRDLAYGQWRERRLGLARWVCGGESTYPTVGTPPKGAEECLRCKKLDPWRQI